MNVRKSFDNTARAFIRFNQGVLAMRPQWKIWLLVLISANLITPLFFVERMEAQATIGALLTSIVLMTALTARFGYSRILGLGHLPWIPLLAFLATRLSSIPENDIFGQWLRVVIVLNSISLVIDTVDVVRFARVQRTVNSF